MDACLPAFACMHARVMPCHACQGANDLKYMAEQLGKWGSVWNSSTSNVNVLGHILDPAGERLFGGGGEGKGGGYRGGHRAGCVHSRCDAILWGSLQRFGREPVDGRRCRPAMTGLSLCCGGGSSPPSHAVHVSCTESCMRYAQWSTWTATVGSSRTSAAASCGAASTPPRRAWRARWSATRATACSSPTR